MGTKTAQAEQIKGRQIGQNILITIGKDKYSRRFKNKKERENVLDLVEAFNKRNSKTKKKEIISLMTADRVATEKKKASTKQKAKAGPSKTKQPKARAASAMEIANATKLLIDNGYTVAKASPTRRRGEY